MRITLTVIAGPHEGLEFAFDRHDTFLVGRSQHAHFQLPMKDRYFSRLHFMVEVNPPQCRLIDMGSHNGTYVNSHRVLSVDLRHGDEIRAGHTVLRLAVLADEAPSAPAASEPSVTAPDGPPTLPGYVLGDVLGSGNLGVVYRAQQLSDGKEVAVKFLRPERPPTPREIDDFLRSVRYLLGLSHPHLVRMRDLGWDGGHFSFVTDSVPVPSATAVVARDGPLTIPRAVRWASQLLQALGHAHAQQLVHRDVKPNNLLVAAREGREHVVLTDFGLARAYQAAPFSGLSITRDLLGAALFVPPEFLLSYQAAHPAGDQYAAAATLYYLLTGAAPLELPAQVGRRVSTLLRQQAVPLRDRRAEVPPALAEAIHKALQRAPEKRYRDVNEFRMALIRAVQGE